MKPSNANAFLNSTAGAAGPTSKRLAGLLAPMRAQLRETVCGWGLELEPMRAVDALVPWATLSADTATATLLLAPGPASSPSAGSLAAIATRLDLDVREVLGPDRLVMDHEPLRALLALTEPDGVVAVLVEGPIEDGDAVAIESALAGRRSPFQAEMRAAAAMRIVRDRAVFVETRSRAGAAALVAENFRHYLGAVLDRPSTGIAAPELELIDGLLDRSGWLTVRPIETETFSTAVDVGISTKAPGTEGPADASLIYDRCANTWHGD